MSVYIKGLDIDSAKKNGEVIIIYPSGVVMADGHRLFQAIPVPAHGDLIERDALRCLYDPHDYGLDGEQADEYDRYHVSLPVIRQNIDDMPTIIPADKESGE
jgi:hypothetical protein